jgi:hypothetical protein
VRAGELADDPPVLHLALPDPDLQPVRGRVPQPDVADVREQVVAVLGRVGPDQVVTRVERDPQPGHLPAQLGRPGRVVGQSPAVRLDGQHHPLGLRQPGQPGQAGDLGSEVGFGRGGRDVDHRDGQDAAEPADGPERLPVLLPVRGVDLDVEGGERDVPLAQELGRPVDVRQHVGRLQVRAALVQGQVHLVEVQLADGVQRVGERVPAEAE